MSEPTPPTGTVTFLFTDIEGSTRRWQDEPEAMRALLLGHYAILREVIDKHHGHLFKRTGDGVAVVSGASANASRGGGRRRSLSRFADGVWFVELSRKKSWC